jgi:hypothetical protein
MLVYVIYIMSYRVNSGRENYQSHPGSFSIIRRVSSQSRKAFRFSTEFGIAFPGREINPRPFGKLALTLLEGDEVNRLEPLKEVIQNKKLRHTARQDLPQAIIDTFPSRQRMLTLDVLGVEVFGKNPYRKSLVVTLNDRYGELDVERECIRNCIAPNRPWNDLVPHVTFAGTDIIYATSDVIAWAEAHVPDTVRLIPPEPKFS